MITSRCRRELVVPRSGIGAEGDGLGSVTIRAFHSAALLRIGLSSNEGSQVLQLRLKAETGRGDRIRTCDILLPKQARYRTAPLPDATARLKQNAGK
jgi:hypothetical protein